ncbi:MAG: hypothetical protein LBF86_04835 [Helicobacteraceae bacterium]|jgi:hypothetical protein|nr:hypothetical protein [Helicobacteraceae bacterium]
MNILDGRLREEIAAIVRDELEAKEKRENYAYEAYCVKKWRDELSADELAEALKLDGDEYKALFEYAIVTWGKKRKERTRYAKTLHWFSELPERRSC